MLRRNAHMLKFSHERINHGRANCPGFVFAFNSQSYLITSNVSCDQNVNLAFSPFPADRWKELIALYRHTWLIMH